MFFAFFAKSAAEIKTVKGNICISKEEECNAEFTKVSPDGLTGLNLEAKTKLLIIDAPKIRIPIHGTAEYAQLELEIEGKSNSETFLTLFAENSLISLTLKNVNIDFNNYNSVIENVILEGEISLIESDLYVNFIDIKAGTFPKSEITIYYHEGGFNYYHNEEDTVDVITEKLKLHIIREGETNGFTIRTQFIDDVYLHNSKGTMKIIKKNRVPLLQVVYFEVFCEGGNIEIAEQDWTNELNEYIEIDNFYTSFCSFHINQNTELKTEGKMVAASIYVKNGITLSIVCKKNIVGFIEINDGDISISADKNLQGNAEFHLMALFNVKNFVVDEKISVAIPNEYSQYIPENTKKVVSNYIGDEIPVTEQSLSLSLNSQIQCYINFEYPEEPKIGTITVNELSIPKGGTVKFIINIDSTLNYYPDADDLEKILSNPLVLFCSANEFDISNWEIEIKYNEMPPLDFVYEFKASKGNNCLVLTLASLPDNLRAGYCIVNNLEEECSYYQSKRVLLTDFPEKIKSINKNVKHISFDVINIKNDLLIKLGDFQTEGATLNLFCSKEGLNLKLEIDSSNDKTINKITKEGAFSLEIISKESIIKVPEIDLLSCSITENTKNLNLVFTGDTKIDNNAFNSLQNAKYENLIYYSYYQRSNVDDFLILEYADVGVKIIEKNKPLTITKEKYTGDLRVFRSPDSSMKVIFSRKEKTIGGINLGAFESLYYSIIFDESWNDVQFTKPIDIKCDITTLNIEGFPAHAKLNIRNDLDTKIELKTMSDSINIYNESSLENSITYIIEEGKILKYEIINIAESNKEVELTARILSDPSPIVAVPGVTAPVVTVPIVTESINTDAYSFSHISSVVVSKSINVSEGSNLRIDNAEFPENKEVEINLKYNLNSYGLPLLTLEEVKGIPSSINIDYVGTEEDLKSVPKWMNGDVNNIIFLNVDSKTCNEWIKKVKFVTNAYPNISISCDAYSDYSVLFGTPHQSIVMTLNEAYFSEEESVGESLEKGEIIGISVGCVAFVILISTLIYFLACRKKKDDKSSSSSSSSSSSKSKEDQKKIVGNLTLLIQKKNLSLFFYIFKIETKKKILDRQDFLLRELARNILLGQVHQSYYFIKTVKEATFFDFIKEIESFGPPKWWNPTQWNPDYSCVKWKFHCCIPNEYYFDERKKLIPPLGEDLFIYLLRNIHLSWAYDLINYIDNRDKELTKKQKSELSLSCIILHNQFSNLYYALMPIIEELLEKIGPQIIYDNVQVESLQLSMQMNSKILPCFGSNLTSVRVFNTLWDNDLILLDDKTSILLQSLFQCAEPFPKESVLFNTNNLLTLANQIIVKKNVQLLDFLVNPCYSMILENEDVAYDWINTYLSTFPTVKFLLPILFFESLYKNQILFNKLIDKLCDTNTEWIRPAFNECIRRFKNDSTFFTFLRNVTGITARPELNRISIPFFLGSSIEAIDMEDVVNFMKKPYFIIDDNSTRMDFLFIVAEKCLELAINFVETGNMEYFSFNEWLPLITDSSIRNMIIDDIFSLIFLKKDEKQVCSVESANAIIDYLLELRDDEEFVRTKEKLSYAILGNETIDSCFNDNNWLINRIIQSQNAESYLGIIPDSSPVKEIILRTVLAAKAKNGEQFTFAGLRDKFVFACDIFLSMNIGNPLAQEKESSIVNDMLDGILENRLSAGDPLTVVDAATLRAVINAVTSNDCRISFDRYPLLKLFVDFEVLSKKLEFSGCKLTEIINSIITEDKKESLEMFLNVAGASSVDFIILYKARLGKNFKAIIDEKWPLLSIFLEDDEDKRDDKVNRLKNNKVIKNYFTRKETSEEKVSFDERIKAALEENNVEELNDLFYQCKSEEEYLEIVTPHIKKLTLEEISKILPFSCYDSLHLIKDKSCDLVVTIGHLFEDKEYYKLKVLAKEFNMNDFVEQKAKEIFAEAQNKEISEYKLYFPESIIELKKEEDPGLEKIKAEARKETEKFIKFVSLKLEDSNSFVHFLHLFSKHETKIETKLMIFAIERSCSVIKRMNIYDSETEFRDAYIFRRIFNALLLMKSRLICIDDFPQFEALFTKLDILSRFMKRYCFQRFGIKYKLNNFANEEFGAFLLNISTKYDFPNLALDVISSYNLNCVDIMWRSLCCFEMGFLEDGIIELERVFAATDLKMLNSRIIYNLLTQKILHKIPVDIDFLVKCSKDENSNFEEGSMAEIVRKVQDSMGTFGDYSVGNSLVLNSRPIRALDKAMDIACVNHERVEFFASIGKFDSCFKAFQILGPTPHHFLKYIVSVCISRMQWGLLWHQFSKKKEPENYKTYESLIKDLLQLLKAKEAYTVMLDVFHRIDDQDGAINLCFTIFLASDSWESMEKSLEQMRIETQKAMLDDSTVVYTMNKLFELQRRFELQISVVSMFKAMKKPFDINLQLVTSRKSSIKLGVELLLDWNTGFLFEMCDFEQEIIDDICEGAVSRLSKDRKDKLPYFIKNMKTLKGNDAFIFIPPLCRSFRARISTDAEYLNFLEANVTDPEIRKLCM